MQSRRIDKMTFEREANNDDDDDDDEEEEEAGVSRSRARTFPGNAIFANERTGAARMRIREMRHRQRRHLTPSSRRRRQ